MRLFGVQLNTVWEDKPASEARVRDLLRGVDVREGDLVVLPEMWATGFSLDTEKIAEDAGNGRAQSFLSSLATEMGAFVLGGVVTRGAGGKGNNEAVTYGPDGREVCRYRKLFPFTPGGEADHYHAGDRGAHFAWHGFGVAPFICYDLRFPEVFRGAVANGAEIYAVMANWPSLRRDHWTTLLCARAIENQAYVIGVNRCGDDPDHAYPGCSRIIDPSGNVLTDAGEDETVINAEPDRAALIEWRRSFPALSDIRAQYLPPDRA